MVAHTVGRRERKKTATRKAIGDAARRLFLKKGFDAVTVREVAEAADVSTTTLMTHFPTKEALVFDKDHDLEEALTETILQRENGISPLSALRSHMRERISVLLDSESAKFLHLVQSTPALREHWRMMWIRHERAVASVLAEASGGSADQPSFLALAHLALEASLVAARSGSPLETFDVAFSILQDGWLNYHDAQTKRSRVRSTEGKSPHREQP